MFRLLEIGEKIKLGDEMLFEVPDGPQMGAWAWCSVPASYVGLDVTGATMPMRRAMEEVTDLDPYIKVAPVKKYKVILFYGEKYEDPLDGTRATDQWGNRL